MALAGRHGIDVPPEVAGAGWLTPWAAEFRYDDAPLHSLDRDITLEIGEKAAAWSGGLIG